ncbi:hypothetical protein [Geminocystis sp. GBBB08]|uniref:hypothetical protein n=1 Tax=Geminocystis sp. GBBB08 TaxID=2604140 RepID=UPI0027E2BF1A|nr:hypothetical protein [Geminocystis sp. GBBB08]MBL1209590.1 hypothetical protein [Geminocystis sp. GBBB08]
MSGSPKYSHAELQRQEQERLERERKRKAEEEERKRLEAIEKERIRQLNVGKSKLGDKIQSALNCLQQQSSELYQQDFSNLETSFQNLLSQTQQAHTETDLEPISNQISPLRSQINEAVSRKRWDETQKQLQAELDQLRFQSEEFLAKFGHISSEDGEKFDSEGKVKAEQALSTINSTLATNDVNQIKSALSQANELVNSYIKTVEANRSQWQKQKMSAESSLNQLQSLIVGYQVDTNLMKWCGNLIPEFDEQVKLAQEAIASENFNEPATILAEVKAKGNELIEKANQAQIDRDKSDRIIEALMKSCKSLGLMVSQPNAEHPNHPATAMRLIAKDPTGKGFIASVLMKGDIHFEVQGYQKTQRGKFSSCDDAEIKLTQILQEMSQYGVNMGQLYWQNQDNNSSPSDGKSKDLSDEDEQNSYSN